ncbi:MAG: hypothetical protein U5R48_12600 [Gammaproteobacteria bacterium]|nr:hypothetical protein [Gammaproteobacteria bacterium]
MLGKEIIINHMLPEQKTRIEMEIGVAYGTDLEQATEILQAITREMDRILQVPTPESRAGARRQCHCAPDSRLD